MSKIEDTALYKTVLDAIYAADTSSCHDSECDGWGHEDDEKNIAHEVAQALSKREKQLLIEARIDELKELQMSSNVSDEAKDQNWQGYIEERIVKLKKGR